MIEVREKYKTTVRPIFTPTVKSLYLNWCGTIGLSELFSSAKT